MSSHKNKMWLVVLLSLFAAIGCSSTPDDQADKAQANDPFEGFNRSMWTLNYEYLDPYVARPVSLAYVHYTPTPVRYGIINFLANLDEPTSVVNNAVMGNSHKAVDHFNRFMINSTFGIFGLFDVASKVGIPKDEEKDFSDVAGHYGVGNGPYFMVPGYGPFTLRQTTDLVDSTYGPLSYLNIWASIGKWLFEGMETRAALVPQEAQLDNSPDPYALTRDVYLQRRDYKAEIDKDKKVDEAEEDYLDNYMDENFN